MEFCTCSRNKSVKPSGTPPWNCEQCGKIIPCEFCNLDALDGTIPAPKPAMHHHIDYFACDEHIDAAIDNVYSRT